MRVDLLLRISRDGPTSPKELAKRMCDNLNQVAYHIRVLADYNAIILIDTKQRRGASEHYYITNPNSDLMAVLLQQRLAGAAQEKPDEFLESLLKQSNESISSIATTIPLQVDAQGVKEVRAAVEALTQRLKAVEVSSSERSTTSEADITKSVAIGILAFPWEDRGD